jgi:dolichyl-phosphate beta-glucosyltransferase
MGMLNARGKYVLFMDADGATPLDEISKLLTSIQEGLDIVIGSRVAQHPNETKVSTSLHRKLLGRVFATLVNLLVVSEFADTQCGFKMFRHEVVHEIFSRQQLTGFAFDVEILYIAKKLGFAIAEVPVNWENQEGSKVNLITDSVKMLVDILRIRWLHFSDFSHAG